MVMKKKILRIRVKMIQLTQLFKTTDLAPMPDFGLYLKRELIRDIAIKSSLLMRLPMAMRKKILRTKVRTTQLIQLFKTMDLELMPDFGLCTKRELIPMLKEKANTDLESHPTRSLMVMKKKISRTKVRTIQLIQWFKTTDSALTPDSGPSTKDLHQDTTTTTSSFNLLDHQTRSPTVIERMTYNLKTREMTMMPLFKIPASDSKPNFSSKLKQLPI